MSASIYLDNHAATKPCAPALERMRPYLEEQWGASSAPHSFGREQIAALDGRLQMIYDLVSAKKEDRFLFTSSSSHAVQQVLFSAFLEVSRKEGKIHFAASCLEDAPLMLGMKRLEELGCFVKIVPCTEQGTIDLAQLEELLNPRTALFSMSLAQGLTGVVQPLDEIARLCRSKGVLLHVDATYAVGKMALEMEADYLTFGGDRMHALKSSGAFFAKAKAPIAPLLFAENIDTPSLVALSAASQQAMMTLDLMGLEIVRLRNLLEEELERLLPGAKSLFKEQARLPNVAVISFPGVHQEALLYALNRKKVFASIGGNVQQSLSKLLMAAGVPEGVATGAIHFALSRFTTEAEIREAALRIKDAVLSLQEMSRELD